MYMDNQLTRMLPLITKRTVDKYSQCIVTIIVIIYQLSKLSFSCVSLVESLSREIDEIKLSPSHQRERETMHYSPVDNEKNHVHHHVNTRPLDSRRKLRMF